MRLTKKRLQEAIQDLPDSALIYLANSPATEITFCDVHPYSFAELYDPSLLDWQEKYDHPQEVVAIRLE